MHPVENINFSPQYFYYHKKINKTKIKDQMVSHVLPAWMFVLRSLCSAGSDGFVHSKPTEEVLGSRQQTFVFPTVTARHSSSEHGPKEPHCRSSLAAPALRFLPRLLSPILQGEPCHPGVSRPPNDSDLSHVKDHECEGRGPPPPAESPGGLHQHQRKPSGQPGYSHPKSEIQAWGQKPPGHINPLLRAWGSSQGWAWEVGDMPDLIIA